MATATQARVTAEARRQLAQRSPLWFRLFAGIFARSLRRDFHAVRVSKMGGLPEAACPRLVVYSNHPSWWDAAIFTVLIDRLFPGRPGFAPIDAAMMNKYGFMARIGAFGVEQDGRRGAAQFLAAAGEILRDPRGLLFITAQGRFADVRERPVRLAPGLVHLVEQTPDAMLQPLALDYPFWDERKPELLLRFGTPIAARDLMDLDRAGRQAALTAGLERTMDALVADALSRDPARFTVLLEGAAGVGGIYDLWRRTRATLKGQRFSPAHGEPS